MDAQAEDCKEETGRGVAVPEPQWAWQHGGHSVAVLDAHECGLLQGFGEREHKFANPGFGVGFSQPGEGGWAAGGDFLAASNGDEEVVGELPDCVGNGGPECHGQQGVVRLRAWWGVLDCPYGVEALFLVVVGEKMNQAVKSYTGHDMDEQAGYFVEAVKDHRVPPHCNGDGIVTEG